MVYPVNPKLLWHLFAGTKGGATRLRIIKELTKQPKNAHQITKAMKMDYKTIRHHLKVLSNNKLIIELSTSPKNNYGATYHISDFTKSNKKIINEIWEKVNKPKKGNK
jgi:predicted transcriptional regulator